MNALTAELAHTLVVTDAAPAIVVRTGREAWSHRSAHLEVLEIVFDSDRTESLAGAQATRIIAFSGPITLFTVHLRRDGDRTQLTAYLEDVDGVELGVSGPESKPEVIGVLSGHRVQSVLLLRGPVRFWLRAPARSWRSATEWVLHLREPSG